MPIADLGATTVAATAPRTNEAAAAANINFLIDVVGAALVWTSGSSAGIVLYREAVMLIVGIACAAIGRCVLPLEVAWRAHLASRNARLRRNYSGGRAARA